MPKLQVENITKQYPTRAEPIEVLRGVSLELDPGQNLAIVGPSGSGKSTLLSILGTLETPTSGRVLLDGVDPAELDERQLAAFRSRRVGFVFQDHYLLPQCSVLENVLLPAVPLGPVRASRSGGPRCCWNASAWPIAASIARRNSPAASGSGPPWPGPHQCPRSAPGRRADRQPRSDHGPADRAVARRIAEDRAHDPHRRHA